MIRHFVQCVQDFAGVVVRLLKPVLHACLLVCVCDLVDLESKGCNELVRCRILTVIAYSAPENPEYWVDTHESHIYLDDVLQLLDNERIVH